MVFELFALLIALPASYVLAKWLKKSKHNEYQDELDRLFLLNWNGKQEEEIYAWFRVRMYINKSQANTKKLKYIDKKIQQVNKYHLYSDTRISTQGEILADHEDWYTNLV